MKKTLLALSVAFSLTAHANSQWQTIETDNFKVHFSKEYQDWARSAANELEIVRTKVLEQQNRALDKKVDVLVFDPFNQPNGFAIPASKAPLMAFFATPPQSDTVISNSSGWQQLLALHEYIHLVHLAQPSRSEWKQTLRNVYGLYDVSQGMQVPRWAAEGYATLLESQMTGRGRLHDNYVESLISQFAKEGMLPTYDQLSATEGGYMTGSMAYLVGVRYLQWLEDTFDKATLDAVWTRLQAVESRDFEEAFKGAFGQPAQTLYRRFVAEYTYKTLAKEQQQAELKTDLWFDLTHIQQSPSLSPEQDKIAMVSVDKKGNTQLNIFATADNKKAAEEFSKKQQEILADDPKDITDKAPTVFAREEKNVLQQIDQKGIMNPQWLDNDTLIFGAFSVANNELNTRHQDLFRYDTNSGKVEQLTELANLRRFSISGDKTIAYAERAQFGYSELVKVDLSSGLVTEITSKDLATVYDFPIVHQNKLAYLKTALNENWALWVKNLDDQTISSVPMPAGYQFLSYPAWSADGQSIYYVAGVAGETNIYRYDFTGDRLVQLTQGQQVTAYPMPMQDGGILYQAINSQGPDLYKLAADAAFTEVTERAAVRIADTSQAQSHKLPAAKIYQQAVGESQNYNPTEQNITFNIGEQYASASTTLLQLGIKGGDFLNQLTWQIGGAFDNKSALSGAYAEVNYQALPVELSAHVFSYDLKSANQLQRHESADTRIKASGIYTQMSYPYRNDQFLLTSHLAYNYSDYDVNDTQWLRVGIDQQWQRDWQKFAIGQSVKARAYEGDNDGQDWHGYDLTATLFGKAWHLPLYGEYQKRSRTDSVVSLGGFESTLIKADAHAEYVIAPELPFLSISGEEFESVSGGMSFKAGMPWFYYQQYKMDGQEFADSYGVKWQQKVSFGLGPAAINDLNINFGVVKVAGDTIEDEIRGWFGVWYSL
ncbi:TolB family protein [Pseudoalteromonas tunicata]|uniref:Uncharacterized protein n=1 Tax=Pseudoalteromonas tunicata D2 TaxID=87626 RepID=A4CDV2_9GAMM|nr:PD40 domain-containing protein [Pseudoalteromonas tunicata]ATC96363.1 hypothetical protein PTUN_a4151 [Pseudoalteromonas tunicata]AXT31859.1 hypothetical protein D1819_14240 [Pseudoalteromonas tunicata]EAR27144.1 hypothetical protein PTD2_05720 [Pseudoalteromonas tunicata D2]